MLYPMHLQKTHQSTILIPCFSKTCRDTPSGYPAHFAADCRAKPTRWIGRYRHIMKPEELARQKIDAMLAQAGWAVQDRQRLNLYATRGVVIREFSVMTGAADYLL